MFNNTYHVTAYNFKFSSLLKISLFNAELCQWQSYLWHIPDIRHNGVLSFGYSTLT